MLNNKKRNINGWLIADKPEGMTSTRLCTLVKRVFSPKKIGHAGTLDPLASGVLPLALGDATKTVSFAMDGCKTYQFILAIGQERDTDDREGEIVRVSDVVPSVEKLERVLPQFTGDVLQTPPAYSALKIRGKRACDRMRRGEEVQLSPRQVHIHAVKLLKKIDTCHFLFEAHTGKGVYIRSLARDIAYACDTVGYVSYLRRTKVGRFAEKDAIPLDKLKTNSETVSSLDTLLYPVSIVLDDIPALNLHDENAYRFRCGQRLSLAENGWLSLLSHEGQLIRINGQNAPQNYLALGYIENKCLRPKRLLTED